ncbi:Cytochrome P450 [Streptomyces clavuligerus]|uniref:Cytochrome P450 n=1 Tax=Streptomyces clavuligerus TaxID=1901 RepID=E2Q8N1_STRCL|nr:Cytochrome P450 [Streptomyces clavuligerus]
MISDLAALGELPEEEIVALTAQLIFAGHSTAVRHIVLGVLRLLRHPEQYTALGADPSLVPGAVEEMLRMSVPSDHGLVRYAHTDLTVDRVTIATSDAVLLFHRVANRDPAAFPDLDRFDTTRRPDHPSLAFGYATRLCVGAQLARAQLQSILTRLPHRFPALHLAVAPDTLRPTPSRITGGLEELPVTWRSGPTPQWRGAPLRTL